MSAHTIDATPARPGNRRTAAEEPVTARIRRRTETAAVSAPADPSSLETSPALTPDASDTPHTHQQRAATRRAQSIDSLV
jgi:hypothetical protein